MSCNGESITALDIYHFEMPINCSSTYHFMLEFGMPTAANQYKCRQWVSFNMSVSTLLPQDIYISDMEFYIAESLNVDTGISAWNLL